MIWCVEDDAGIRDIALYALSSAGFETEGFADGAACWQALQTRQPELLLLDVMLPGMSGIELLGRLKASGGLCRIPVIMATAKGAEYDKIQALDLGADDYLVKPYSMLEMISRVKAVLRRCQNTRQPELLQLGQLVLNPQEHTLTVAGRRVDLTYKEYTLLQLFLTHPGKAFTREELLRQVWQQDFLGQTRTVDMHIRTLRQKLGPQGRLIETVRNVGYRMEAAHDQ